MKKSPAKKIKTGSFRDKRLLALFIVGFAALGAYLILQTSAAPKDSRTAAVTLFLSPSSQRLSTDQTIDLQVRLNTNGQLVNAVQADLQYPSDKFEFVQIDPTSSAFGIEAASTGGGGNISISRGSIEAVNSMDALVATVRLRANSNGRKVTVSFLSTSAVVRPSDGADILAKKVNGQYTIQ